MINITFVITVIDNIYNTLRCIESIDNLNIKEKQIIFVSNIFNKSELSLLLKDSNKKFNESYEYIYSLDTLGSLRNKALNKVKGEYICFLNNNDFYDINEMEHIFSEIKLNGANLAIGRVFYFNEKEISYSFEKTNKVLMCKNILRPIDNFEVFYDCNINNKIFKTKLIRDNDIKFADTEYYDYIPFVVEALICTDRLLINPKAHYIKTIKVGLDKINNPDLDEKIDFKQLDDFIKININETKNKYSNYKKYIINKKYIDFLLNRGLNYLNISEDKESILRNISKSIKNMDIENFDLDDSETYILNLIKDERFNDYFNYLEKNRVRNLKKAKPLVYFKQILFKLIYNLFSKFSIKKNSVLFLSHSPGMDGNFGYINDAIKEYNKTVKRKRRFKTYFKSTKSNLIGKLLLSIKIARVEFIILSESIPFFQHVDIRKDTNVIQSWHAAGAFKKFGYSTNYLKGGPNPFKNKKMNIHKGYDYATVSAKEVEKYYAEAFNMDIDKIIPIGVPRTDFFFLEDKVNEAKNKVYNLYPQLKNKKVILYAPTFRGVGKSRKNFKMEFDFNKIAEQISDEYIIVLKLHPSVESSNIKIKDKVKNKIVNASSYKDANDILTVTDLLITDYSSIIFDYSLLSRPMIFFAYDLEDYLFDRDFYYKYENFVPGPIARSNNEIIKIINENKFDLNKVNEFCNKFFISNDGNSSKRFVYDVLLKIKNKEI